jgi:putative multiple sugar transport system permease protein
MEDKQIPEMNEKINVTEPNSDIAEFMEQSFNFPVTTTPQELDRMNVDDAKAALKNDKATMKNYFKSLSKLEQSAARKQYRRQSEEVLKSYIAGLPVPPALPTQDEMEALPRKERKEIRNRIREERAEFFQSLPPLQASRIRSLESQIKINQRTSVVGNSLKKYSMLVALIMIMILFTILTRGRLVNPMNLSNLVFQNAYVVIMAVGMLLCILTGGNIDLSVGSVVGFIAGIAGWLMILKDFPVLPSILICLFAGILIGCWHGFWIAYIGIPSFITTLAGMLIFRGLTMFVLRGGETVNKFPTSFMILSTGHVPDLFPIFPTFNLTCLFIGILAVTIFVFFRFFGRFRKKAKGYKVGNALSFNIVNIAIGIAVIAFTTQLARYKGLPTVIFILMIIIVIYTILTSMTVPGRYLYALGGNPKAAKLSGIDTKKVMFLAYTNMAFLAAVAGLVFAARLDAAIPAGGTGFELDAIGSCFIGGASAYGGIGTVGGVLIGAIFMGVMNNGMNLFGIQTDVQQVVKGLVLLLAVAFDVVSKRKTR